MGEEPVESTLDLDPAAIDKALLTLNGMIVASQVNLDAKEIECKEFEESNRKTAFQVNADLDEIGAMITTLNGKKSGIIASQLAAQEDGRLIGENQNKTLFEYTKIHEADMAVLGVHKADLAV